MCHDGQREQERTIVPRAKSNSRRLVLSATLFAICSGSALAATGPPVKKQFHLEAQPLHGALAAWAEQSGLDYVWDFDPSISTSAVTGSFTPEEALTQLLSGTSQTYSMLTDRIVSIRPETKKAGGNPTPARREASRERSRKQRTQDIKAPIELADVIVTGTHIPGDGPVGSPVIVLNEEEIRNRGYTRIEQILQALPELTRSVSGESAAEPESSGVQ